MTEIIPGVTWIALASLVVGGVALAAVAGLLVFRLLARGHPGNNDVAGILFGAVGILYGALLAFIVFATWESYSGAEREVTTEGADIIAVYRDTQQFPDPLREQTQAALRTYLNAVMDREWASHGLLLAHTTPDLLNPVWDLYRQVEPSGVLSEAEYASATERLHQLEIQRHLRHLSGEQTLPDLFWPVLIAGSIIVILFSFAFHQERVATQAVMTGLLAALLSMVLLLIFSLNQPFTGPIPVTKQPLLHALAMFDAIDLPAATARYLRLLAPRIATPAMATGRSGGMAYAADLKSAARKGV